MLSFLLSGMRFLPVQHDLLAKHLDLHQFHLEYFIIKQLLKGPLLNAIYSDLVFAFWVYFLSFFPKLYWFTGVQNIGHN